MASFQNLQALFSLFVNQLTSQVLLAQKTPAKIWSNVGPLSHIKRLHLNGNSSLHALNSFPSFEVLDINAYSLHEYFSVPWGILTELKAESCHWMVWKRILESYENRDLKLPPCPLRDLSFGGLNEEYELSEADLKGIIKTFGRLGILDISEVDEDVSENMDEGVDSDADEDAEDRTMMRTTAMPPRCYYLTLQCQWDNLLPSLGRMLRNLELVQIQITGKMCGKVYYAPWI
ncbi:hypothetical protein M422DRAFT_256609 [Sphaerobolus stellatus SS14]|uniref:Uncharacterized protein n=1 Tax=Sphaerobolus stellatus (strain SS14) TaxID=990650 RepID=A0A0C9VG36_SPHS4|nr:hypothetical protein M422DRAFT_256609 [Sphaerobolus stellatus SS14]